MYQPILFDTDINEHPELGDIGHNPGHRHALFQIFHRLNGLFKTEFFDRVPRITARLLQLLQNIVNGEFTHRLRNIFFPDHLFPQFLLRDQIRDRTLEV